MDRTKDIVMKPMTFYMVLIVVLLLGMAGMWAIGKFFPGTLGVTTERARAARLAARMQNMMRSRRNSNVY
jgi:hypothetical protein